MNHLTQLQVLFAGELVGTLATHHRQYWFQYDSHWIQYGFDLSPQTLNFTIEPQLAKLPVFQGLHGIFHDSLPDGWGLLLMDRFFKRELGWDYQKVTPLDRLAYLGHRAMGALEYEPVIGEEKTNDLVDLMTLAQDAECVLAGKSKAILNQLRILGGSPGGARPKVTIGLADHSDDCIAGLTVLPKGFSPWLVKFRSEQDPKDLGRIEKVYAELAILAGIKIPPNRLIHVSQGRRSEDFFAVQRFDRQSQEKYHMLSLGGYIYADHRAPSIDYQAFLAATAMLTKDIREIERAYRLMVFNVVMHNKDDHAKNFCFLHPRRGDWHLAPGYDLTFNHGMNNEHITAINGNGNPSRKDLKALANAHDIQHWEKIIDEVLAATDHWQALAKNYQVTSASVNRITRALNLIKKQLD